MLAEWETERAELETELEPSKYTFTIASNQLEAFKEWDKVEGAKETGYAADGARCSFSFTPSASGTRVLVEDGITGGTLALPPGNGSVSSVFIISDPHEIEEVDDFINDEDSFTFRFTPTMIGTVINVRNNTKATAIDVFND